MDCVVAMLLGMTGIKATVILLKYIQNIWHKHININYFYLINIDKITLLYLYNIRNNTHTKRSSSYFSILLVGFFSISSLYIWFCCGYEVITTYLIDNIFNCLIIIFQRIIHNSFALVYCIDSINSNLI